MDLNADLKWDNQPREVRDAFDKGNAEKVMLNAGFKLYKFTHGDISFVDPQTSVDSKKVTPWWSPFSPYKKDTGLHARLRRARDTDTCPVRLTRQLTAVRNNWNNMTHLLTAFLDQRVNVWAFWGYASGQVVEGHQTIEHMERFDMVLTQLMSGRLPERKMLPGGAGQFYIPNLIRNEHIWKAARVPAEDLDLWATYDLGSIHLTRRGPSLAPVRLTAR